MSIYSIPPLAASLITLTVGLIVLIRGKKLTYTLVTFSVFVWLFGYALMYSTKNYDFALSLAKLSYIGVVFIPVFSYHFTVSFLNLTKQRMLLILNYLVGLLFVSMIWKSSFIAGLYSYYWGYQTKVGPSHNIFFIFFSIIMLRVIFLLYRAYRRTKTEGLPLENTRIKYVLLSYMVSFLAAVDFLPNYGIEWYPLGFICIIFHALATTYAIIKYRLLNVTVVITRAGIFFMVYLTVLGLPFGIGYMLIGKGLWIIPLLAMAVFATAGPFIYTYLQRKAESRLRREEFQAHQALNSLAQNMMRYTKLETLLRLIVHHVVKIMKVNVASIYLKDQGNEHYPLRATWGINGASPKQAEFSEDSELVKDMLVRGMPVVLEELLLHRTFSAASHTRKLQAELHKAQAAVVIPALKGDSLFGFLMLGARRDNRLFTQEDLNLLTLLGSQSVFAIENAQLIEKEKTFLAEKSRRDALADMAPGVAHQFNNRLISISMVADTQFALNEEELDKLSPDKLKSLIEQSQKAFESISKDAIRGKDIADAILKKGRAKLAYLKTDLAPIIQTAIELLKVSRTRKSLGGAPEPEVILNSEENLPQLILNESLIQDIFYNLIDNARDATIIKHKYIQENKLTSDITPYKGKVIITVRKKDSKVVVTVNDNGIGMDEKTKSRLFVPYFTTKATALKGTGMGLWVIRSFIEDHKGKISFESECTKGATFTMTFPINET